MKKKDKSDLNFFKRNKKVFLIIGIIFLIIFFYAGFMMAIIPQIDIIEEQYIFGAHRGNSIDFMENTLPAFESALDEEKYKFIEFDIQYTKDKVIVVHHDKFLRRLQGKAGKIPDLNYSELLNISDYHIPTYFEVMEMISNKKPVNVEIKSQGNFTDDKNMADFVIKDLKEREILDSTILSSISKDIIRYINIQYEDNFCLNCEGDERDCDCEFNPSYYGHTKIKTGIIYYIHPETFLLGAYPDGLSMVSSMVGSGADYLMIHGINLRDYKNIVRSLPENTYLGLWYFTDEMYLLIPELRDITFEDIFGVKFVKEKIMKSPESEPCLWWCDSEFNLFMGFSLKYFS